MTRVITYGTFDLLHHGHVRLLERAKQLGDYLIVGVTSEDFDRRRGKINTHQSLMERMAAVRALGIADEIIVEEYVGQKIDDIKRYDIDIFTVGSDWVGQFDYLKEYCTVIYLPRTEGISSSDIRSQKAEVKIAVLDDATICKKFSNECQFVNGVKKVDTFDEGDAVYITSMPVDHYKDIMKALLEDKHVICESPISTKVEEAKELFDLARTKKLVLMDGVKVAYSTAYTRLLVLIKSGAIGEVVSVDAVCTSLADETVCEGDIQGKWNSVCAWGPTALLPIFHILGINYKKRNISSIYVDKKHRFDGFTKIDFEYENAFASIKVAKAAKSEGSLVVTGTKGYVYVPAPWWKMDYFEIRFEDVAFNKRYFYQLDGEGIRYEIVAFAKAIETSKDFSYVGEDISLAIAETIEACMYGE